MKTAARNLGTALGALLVLALAGCVQPCWHNECDWRHVYDQAQLPPRLETRPDDVIQPEVPALPDPATVLNPERTPYYLSLSEAIALALERGTVGAQSVRGPGFAIDDLVAFSGTGISLSDNIRVLAYQPARLGTAIEASIARFDPFWSTGMSWSTIDQPTQGLQSLSNGMLANFSSILAKPISTGGAVGVGFSTAYTLYANPPVGQFGVLNPSYVPEAFIGFEQPLLRFYGVDINQILPSFPGSSLFPVLNGRPASSFEGILVARLRFDQSRAELERVVNYMLLNVEAAYWNLYGAYVALYVSEQGLRQAHMAWMIGKAQLEGGKIDISQLAQIRGQYESFRGDRNTALGNVLTNERNLRVLLGLPVEDGRRLVPIDAPNTAPSKPDWQAALSDTMTLRPELILARQDIKAKQWNLAVQKNFLLPDLRFQSNYTINGLGTRLDGNATYIDAAGNTQPLNALQSLTSTHYANWTVGLTLNMPIGFRFEHAQAREARLQLAQSFILLKNQEQKAVTGLAKQYSTVIEKYNTLQIRRQQRQAQSEQVETRFKKYAAGLAGSPLEFLLQAQLQWTSALSQEYQAIVDYNIALASFEFAKGTIMHYNHVAIGEGPLPACCSVRAVERAEQRTRDAVCAEIDRNSLMHPTANSPLPQWPESLAPSLLSIHHDTVHGLPAPPEDLLPGDTPAMATPAEAPAVRPEPAPTQTAPPAVPPVPLLLPEVPAAPPPAPPPPVEEPAVLPVTHIRVPQSAEPPPPAVLPVTQIRVPPFAEPPAPKAPSPELIRRTTFLGGRPAPPSTNELAISLAQRL